MMKTRRLALLLLALCTLGAWGQRPILEFDVVATDAEDGFTGLNEGATTSLATNTIARVKGGTVPGDGGGGTYLWNGTSWVEYLRDDYATAALTTTVARQLPQLNALEYGAIADGTSNPLSDTYDTLAAAQADYPAATSLTDETDWAAIQSALDTLNTVDGEETGGTVYLPPGHYVTNQTIWLRGPGVTLKGAGPIQTYVEYVEDSGYAVRLGMARGSTIADDGDGGCPKNCSLKGIKFNNHRIEDSTATGFSTIDPEGGEGYWYVLYLFLEECDFEGFDVGVELTNTPITTILNCSITGRSVNLRMIKPDSVTIIGCDLNSTFIDRITDDTPGQIDYHDAINIEMPPAENFSGDEILQSGGGGFHATIIGGELGHCSRVLEMYAGRLTIIGTNVEDIEGDDYAFRVEGASHLTIDAARLELRGTPSDDYPATMILIDGTTGTLSHPMVYLKDVVPQGFPSDRPHVIVKADSQVSGVIRLHTTKPLRIQYQSAAGVVQSNIEKSGQITSDRYPRFFASDTDNGNGFLFKGHTWVGASAILNEDLLTHYETADGVNRRTSLLNDRLIRVIDQINADVASTTGNYDDLHAVTLPIYTLPLDGDKLIYEAAGRFAANGNDKRLILRLNATARTFFDSGLMTHNAKEWRLEVALQRTGANEVRGRAMLLIDGEVPVIQNETEAFNFNAARDFWLETIAPTAAGDIVLESADLKYEKGTSNL